MMEAPMFLTDEPIVQFLPDGRNCVLLSEIKFRDSKGKVWTAKKGKVTDGASIPTPLWFWLGGPYEGPHRDGALLHDEAYGEAPASEATFYRSDKSIGRKDADRMLYEATLCKVKDIVNPVRRVRGYIHAFFIYHGLRIGGAWAWLGHAKENKEKSK
jgi:hypothetical protein